VTQGWVKPPLPLCPTGPKLAGMSATVFLLVPVSVRGEARPLGRSPLGWLRNRARRALDLAHWRVGGTPALHFSTWQDADRCNRGDAAIRLASLDLLRQAFGPDTPLEAVGWDELAGLDPDAVSARARLFVLGGGGYVAIGPGGRLAPRLVRDLAWLRRLRCPVASFAPGVNRALGECDGEALDAAGRATLAELLGLLALSSARDAHSCRVLDLAAPGRPRLLADPALFLAAPARPAAPPATPNDGCLTVGLNLAFHDADVSRLLPARLRLVAAVARDLARQRPCRFVYFVHDQPERLIPRLLRQEGVAVRVVDAPPAQMLAEYQRLDLHVCQMLHSSILAFAAGVPAIALAYDVKNAGLFEMLGLAEFCLSGAAPPLAAAIADALARGPALRRQIATRTAALRAETDAYLAEMAALARPPEHGS
jgi:polysaccharide pyruvyl transferase WcaK-like protein